MIHTKNLENGVMGFGTIESEKDVEKVLAAMLKMFGDDDEDECDDECECECDEDMRDECECECDDDESDGLPHVVSIGYCDELEEVVVMKDNGNKWGLCAALLEAAAQEWPVEEDIDEDLVDGFKELAVVAREKLNDELEDE